MRATVNYASVAHMVTNRLFPEPLSKFGTYPFIAKNGTIIFEGHSNGVTYVRCSIHKDGTLVCRSKAHFEWLQAEAARLCLPLDATVIPPQPQQVKKPKPMPEKTEKPAKRPEKTKKTPGTDEPKPPTSLRDLMKARKKTA